MNTLKLSIGFEPHSLKQRHLRELTAYRQYIYDLHFPHYNPHICASGRGINSKISNNTARKATMDIISWNQKHTGFKMTLLLNYLLHDNYKVVVENVVNEFYPAGIRSFVVADIELIKRLKDALPDIEIQGSCLSHRMTEEELEVEHKAGVSLHNPSINIIRNPSQLKRNNQCGFAQKIIALEGCIHNCPDEIATYGHRWYLARNIPYNKYYCLSPAVSLDSRFFFKANWVTIARLKKLLPFIDVVKLTRCNHLSPLESIKNFIEVFQTDKSYNILDFISAGYHEIIRKEIGVVPSHLFNDSFFDATDNCKMDCEKNHCRLCFEMTEKLRCFNADFVSKKKNKNIWNDLCAFIDKRSKKY